MTVALEDLRERYITERPTYETLARRVQALLSAEVRQRGIICTIDARAKEINSFVKKLLRKQEYDYDNITDKAGVRVIVVYQDTLCQVEQVIRDLFTVHGYEDKRHSLGDDKLGYLGIHFDVSLRDETLAPDDSCHAGKICEIQLHTRAQNLWAEVGHKLLYKPALAPDAQIRRTVNRLVAIVEIFDNEVSNARGEILAHPSLREAGMLEQLERHFYRFTAQPFDQELSMLVLGTLKELFTPAELTTFGERMDAFVNGHEEQLQEIFENYAEDTRRNPLLFQPESLLVFERLESDRFRLKDIWLQILPLPLLQNLADVWGTAL